MEVALIAGVIFCGLLRYRFSWFAIREHVWEEVAPLIWALSLIVVYQSVRSAIDLVSTIKLECSAPTMEQGRIELPGGGKNLVIGVTRKTAPADFQKSIWLAVGVFVFLACAVSIWVGVVVKSLSAEHPVPAAAASAPEPNLAIFMKCDMAGLPVTIPASGSLYIVPVNERYMRTNQWGSLEVNNDGSKGKQWPDEKKIQEAGKMHDVGAPFAYRCEISNHGAVNVLDVAIPMVFWFGNNGIDKNGIHFSPIVSPLDAGHAVELYFVNDCPAMASAALPNLVSLRVVGEKMRRQSTLNLPDRNPADRFMMWFPNNMHWANVTSCS